MELLLHNYVSLKSIKKYYESRPLRRISPYLLDHIDSTSFYRRLFSSPNHALYLQLFHNELSRNKRSYANIDEIINKSNLERIKNEYRKFIEENKYGRVEFGNRPVSIPRVSCAKSNRNSFKYASRRFPNDLGK